MQRRRKTPLHHTVGIDVSKARLHACWLPGGATARFDNTEAGFRDLIAWCGEEVECIAYEAPGPYHRDLEQALLQRRLPAARVNPWQARRFAEASGRRVKTDPADAAMLAATVAVMPLQPTPAGLLATLPDLAGLATVTRQSGRWQGRSFIRGGLRRLLYMPALSASRCNPDLAAFYQHLVETGKPPKAA